MKRAGVLLAVLCLVVLSIGQTPYPPYNPLVIGYSMRPYPAYEGDRIQFTDYSKGAIVSWEWDFGDGTTSTERNPVHVYAAAGEYTITFTISDGTETVTLIRKAGGSGANEQLEDHSRR